MACSFIFLYVSAETLQKSWSQRQKVRVNGIGEERCFINYSLFNLVFADYVLSI